MMSGLSYRPNLRGETVSLLRGARCRRASWAYNSTSRSGGVAHAVVTLKGLRRCKADKTKQECRNQRGGKTTNHVNLLIVGISPRSCRVEAKMRYERRYFQYRLVLGMIWRTDRSADREEVRRARGRWA